MIVVKSFVLGGIIVCCVSLTVCVGQAPVLRSSALPKSFPPIPGQSRIAYFRELIDAKPEEREKLLAGTSPEYRRVLENGVRRYEALAPEERELRLRTMELRFHVTSLLRSAPSNRVERLKLVPERDRSFVQDRLTYWDQLSVAEQKELLDNERMTRDVFSISGPAIYSRQIPLSGQASNQVRRIEEQLVRWQSVPEPRREIVQRHFGALFEFTDAEKAREQLQLPISDEERRQMQAALDHFQKLSPQQRAACIRNFSKFADLSPAERRQFLANVQEWQKMSSEDRQTWRRMVSKVPRMPPLPPGLGQPPLPRRIAPVPPVTVSNTNRQ